MSERIIQRLISVILSFVVSFLSAFGIEVPQEIVWGARGITGDVSTGTEAEAAELTLPEDVTIYYGEVAEEDILVLPEYEKAYASRDLLVQMERKISEEEARELAEVNGAELVGFISLTGTCQWRLSQGMEQNRLFEIQEEVEGFDGVACVSLNYLSDEQPASWGDDIAYWFEGVTKEEMKWGFTKSHGEFAWENQNWMKEPVSVAVLDFGFQKHEKLHYQLCADGAGEDREHGTHVMGIIGAERKNEKKICGIYPKAANRLYAYDVSKTSTMKKISFILNY